MDCFGKKSKKTRGKGIQKKKKIYAKDTGWSRLHAREREKYNN